MYPLNLFILTFKICLSNEIENAYYNNNHFQHIMYLESYLYCCFAGSQTSGQGYNLPWLFASIKFWWIKRVVVNMMCDFLQAFIAWP